MAKEYVWEFQTDINLSIIYATNTRGAGEGDLGNFIITGATAIGLGGCIVCSTQSVSFEVHKVDRCCYIT